MNPLKVSAQFAAYVWYMEARRGATQDEASRFARRNWITLLPAAHKGWGRLLAKVARPRRAAWVRLRPRNAGEGGAVEGMAKVG